jgi:hypothetical protein
MVPRNSFCPPAGHSCVNHGEVEQGFPDANQVLRHKNKKNNNNLTVL